MIHGNSPEADKNQNQQQQKTQEKIRGKIYFLCLASIEPLLPSIYRWEQWQAIPAGPWFNVFLLSGM